MEPRVTGQAIKDKTGDTADNDDVSGEFVIMMQKIRDMGLPEFSHPCSHDHIRLIPDNKNKPGMDQKIAIFQHVPREPAGYLETIFRQKEIPFDYIRLVRNE